MAKKGLTYKSSGVDIDEGERFVKLIKPLVKKTARREQIGAIGGFGGLFSAGFKGLKDPVLVSGTDGVGTKLKVAFELDSHDSVGVDLVAMCVNDIIVSGAEPLFFLDYLATGKLEAGKARDIIKGISKGCKLAGCALLGGETAEMPGMYGGGEYDLAGFAVGVVEKKQIIDGSGVRAGDRIIGLASSGLHSNGFSLARKVIFEAMKLQPADKPGGFRRDIGSTLLTPTRIYVKTVLSILKDFKVQAMAHITGGGMTDNIPRVLPEGSSAFINKGSWKAPPVFALIAEGGGIEESEMLRTFNAGIGYVLIVRKKEADGILKALKGMGEKAWDIGEVRASQKGAPPAVEYI